MSAAQSSPNPFNLPPMPEIGHPEAYYAKRVHYADRHNDRHMHEAYKVGQYITLALDERLTWGQKLKYFQHALRRHCNPPPLPPEPIWLFYRQLTELVRQYAGREALRLALAEDDLYARQERLGQHRTRLAAEARQFFAHLMPAEECPEWFNEDDFRQLKIIRNQWIQAGDSR